MAKRFSLYQIPKPVQKILISLAEALVIEPVDLQIKDRDAEILRRCEALFREMPRYSRVGLVSGLKVFNRLTFLFGFGFQPFTRLKIEKKREYTEAWLKTKSGILRELFKAIRGLVMFTYFSHPDVWQYIRYHPREHVEERIKVRQEILRRKHDSHH